MAPSLVTLILDVCDGSGAPVTGGIAVITPTARLSDVPDHILVTSPLTAQFSGSGHPQVGLLPTDDDDITPAGWAWTVTFTAVPGAPEPFSFLLPADGGATQYLSAVATVSDVTQMDEFLQGSYPGTTTQFLRGDGQWATPAGGDGGDSWPGTTLGDLAYGAAGGAETRLPGQATATRKFLRQQGTGTQSAAPAWDTLQASDIPALPYDAQGAAAAAQSAAEAASDPAGSAATAQSNAETFASGAASTAQSNAEAAAAAAVGDETTRAEAAEAAKLAKASNLSDLASASTARTNLGLGTAATQASTAFDPAGAAATAQSNAEAFATAAAGDETARAEGAEAALAPLDSAALTGSPTAPTPAGPTGIANKGYVDSVAQGLDGKPSARAIATGNISLSGTQTVDGVALAAGDRVLAAGQSAAAQNGLWVVAAGAWARPADFAAGSQQLGAFVFIEAGTAGSQSGWILAGGTPVTVDTTAETWTQFSGAGEIQAGTGLSKSGNTLANTGALTVFGRSGSVVAGSGDYSVGQVTGAAPLASPALTGAPTAPTASAGTDSTQLATTAYADAAVAVETSRAETAEALKAPLASPTFTGTPAAPTKAPGSDSTAIATTAYADAAVAVETSRAETAEALALPLAGGTMSGAIAMGTHKITGLTNGSVATDAAAFGQLPTLSSLGGAPLASPALTGTPTAPTAAALTDSTQLATTAYADAAVAVETSRAETAEALLAPKASPTFTGTPAAPTPSAADNTTKLATTAFVTTAVATETARAETAEALALPLAGGTMSGAIAMGTHKITGLTNGSGAQDAAAFGQLPSSGTPLPLTEGGTGQSESTAALLLAALGALALAGGTMTGALIPAVVALTDASTVAINAALGNQFVLTTTSGVGTTRQLGAPSNPVDGQQILIDVIQDTSGSRVVTYNAVYDFGSGSAPTLSTGANKIDTLGFRYKAVISKWTYLGSGLGF